MLNLGIQNYVGWRFGQVIPVLMGLRRSEIIGLKYSDVDYVNRTLKVERQLGRVHNAGQEEFALKTLTKQEIGLKTESSYRELPIPDLVFEAILEERQTYEKNRSRRIHDVTTPFFDGDYICCSTYGRPRRTVGNRARCIAIFF